MSISVLLSIKPEFAARIFGGTRRCEFRRRVFSNRDVKRIIVYVTVPVRKVIGEFEVAEVLAADLPSLWQQTSAYAGISREYFDSCFYERSIGYAIRIGKVNQYQYPLELCDFHVKAAPQSFVYIGQAVYESAPLFSSSAYWSRLNKQVALA